MSDDLLSWLRTTIEGDLAAAKAADEVSPGPWVNTGQDGLGYAWQIHGAPTGETTWVYDQASEESREVPELRRVATLNYDDGGGVWEREAADHMVLQQPRDTIARCEADLALLNEHAVEDTGFGKYCRVCSEYSTKPGEESELEPAGAPCRTVRLLACGYKNRPGFDPTLVLDPAEVRALLAGAEERLKLPAKPDDMVEMRARLEALKAEHGPIE